MVYLILWSLGAVIGALIFNSKGKSPAAGAAFGFLLGPLLAPLLALAK